MIAISSTSSLWMDDDYHFWLQTKMMIATFGYKENTPSSGC
jgi:hypothetical protein